MTTGTRRYSVSVSCLGCLVIVLVVLVIVVLLGILPELVAWIESVLRRHT